MKLIKLAFALAAGVALLGGTVQAQIPLTVSLTSSFTSGNGTKPVAVVAINSASILSKIASTLAIKFPAGAKLAANTNGNLVVVDSLNNVILDLTVGTNTDIAVVTTSITKGINNSLITNINYTTGYVWVGYNVGASPTDGYEFYDAQAFAFYDAQWAGTETATNIFKVTGKALAGGNDDEPLCLNFVTYSYNYAYNSFGQTFTGYKTRSSSGIELCDSSKAAVACAFSGGVYTLSFTITDSGAIYDNSQSNPFGVVTGVISASGKQTGGQSFLDPFNGAGNYPTDFDDN